MANAWLTHVKSTMKKHKGMKFKDVLKQAAKTYKKSSKASGSKKRSGHKSRKRRRVRKRK